ncbi:S-adenosyl-L-methionine-dependent methyltransferase [Obba rivulosa]|uniref:S-adenosyl-L-methionine-dependent methyltransferase n=1 Tax=Obba rivulosa TaxID=1052685 RepID=A0A8E2ANH4_9APHY|nr:S-adenosyl-L-methionine-dependent methyltransferase [Obba rivulosa]
MPQDPSKVYINNQSESVLRTYRWRTAENSAAYLLPYIQPHMHILDVGCGPGTISTDLATRVPQGRVTGVEYTPEPLDKARAFAAERGVTNIEFKVDNVLALDFPDNTFDVVHAHQVLQHTGDPVQALREMRRVTKPGGIVAARDGDMHGMAWYPEIEGLEGWRKLTTKVARARGGEPDGGRRLLSWALQAGLTRESITCSASTWCYSTPEEREYWGGTMADRMLGSFKHTAVPGGFATEDELKAIADGWREWITKEDGWFAVLHGEIVCRV